MVLDDVEDHRGRSVRVGGIQVGFNGEGESDVDGCVLLLTAEPLLADERWPSPALGRVVRYAGVAGYAPKFRERCRRPRGEAPRGFCGHLGLDADFVRSKSIVSAAKRVVIPRQPFVLPADFGAWLAHAHLARDPGCMLLDRLVV